MVRDKYGRKMSKSLGNVIDPLEVISGCTLDTLLQKIEEGNLPAKEVEIAKAGQRLDFPEGIPECGADALRFGLLAYTVQGRDVNLDIKRVVGYRQFCNKLWNAVKFALTYLTDFTPSPTMHLDIVGNQLASKRDLYILSRLNATIGDCNQSLEQYIFGAAANSLHSFFLYDLCDTYLELIKPVVGFQSAAEGEIDELTLLNKKERRKVAQATLYTCLEQFLRLAHPLMPYVTEELWQRLPARDHLSELPSIMIASYPEKVAEWFNPTVEQHMQTVTSAIQAARSLRADYFLPNHVKAKFFYFSENPEIQAALSQQSDDFCTLAKGESLTQLQKPEDAPKGCSVKIISDQLSLYVDLRGLVNAQDEVTRLSKEVDKLENQLAQYEAKTKVPNYEQKVPENVRKLNAEKLAAYETELAATKAVLASFQQLL